MKPGLVRVALYSLVALALAGALRFTPPLPDAERKPAEVFVAQAGQPAWKLRYDTLGRGESLQSLFKRGGLNDVAAVRAVQAAASASLDQRRIPSGMPVTLRSQAADSSPSEITLQLAIDRLLHLRRSGDASAVLVAGAREHLDVARVDERIGCVFVDQRLQQRHRVRPALLFAKRVEGDVDRLRIRLVVENEKRFGGVDGLLQVAFLQIDEG